MSIDGKQQASVGGFGRDFRTHNISGALFEETEVTKAPTSDMPADSLGGAAAPGGQTDSDTTFRYHLHEKRGSWADTPRRGQSDVSL